MKLCFEIFIFVIFSASFVTSFSWQSCGKSTSPLKITSLDVFSNQSKILLVTGRGKLATNLTAPLQGDVFMQKKFFWGWTTIPCVDQLGSCNYQDICTLSPYLNGPCPPEFTEEGLPCKCPFLEGQYATKKFPIYLNFLPEWMENGKYRIKFRLIKDNEELFCLLINIMLQNEKRQKIY